jgi:hypothetical protein
VSTAVLGAVEELSITPTAPSETNLPSKPQSLKNDKNPRAGLGGSWFGTGHTLSGGGLVNMPRGTVLTNTNRKSGQPMA